MKGNRQGSLSRPITRRSDQNRKIKHCFLFCDFAGSLSKKSVRTFLTRGRAPEGAFHCYIVSGAEQPMRVMPFFSTARAVSASFSRASRTFSASPLMRQAL